MVVTQVFVFSLEKSSAENDNYGVPGGQLFIQSHIPVSESTVSSFYKIKDECEQPNHCFNLVFSLPKAQPRDSSLWTIIIDPRQFFLN